MKAQETEDVELFAVAVLVARETAEFSAAVKQYGEMPWDPNTPAKQTLAAMLQLRRLTRSER